MLPAKYVIIEGTDLSGKTSLYGSIHKKTGFKYNIQDRSYLSMLCYAKLYGRSEESHRRGLREEINNLNNFIVVLLLPKEEILRRYDSRGDEVQNSVTLLKLYDIFKEEVEKIRHAPNVFVVEEVLPLTALTDRVVSKISSYEFSSPDDVGEHLQKLIIGTPHLEDQVQLEMILDPNHSDPEILNDPRETDYYWGILGGCRRTINKEIIGNNPYNAPQGLNSRRFYYNSDTCISSIHFLPRDGDVKVLCTLRSTDVIKNSEIDVRFLAHLSCKITKEFNWPARRIFLRLSFNSAHVRTDV